MFSRRILTIAILASMQSTAFAGQPAAPPDITGSSVQRLPEIVSTSDSFVADSSEPRPRGDLIAPAASGPRAGRDVLVDRPSALPQQASRPNTWQPASRYQDPSLAGLESRPSALAASTVAPSTSPVARPSALASLPPGRNSARLGPHPSPIQIFALHDGSPKVAAVIRHAPIPREPPDSPKWLPTLIVRAPRWFTRSDLPAIPFARLAPVVAGVYTPRVRVPLFHPTTLHLSVADGLTAPPAGVLAVAPAPAPALRRDSPVVLPRLHVVLPSILPIHVSLPDAIALATVRPARNPAAVRRLPRSPLPRVVAPLNRFAMVQPVYAARSVALFRMPPKPASVVATATPAAGLPTLLTVPQARSGTNLLATRSAPSPTAGTGAGQRLTADATDVDAVVARAERLEHQVALDAAVTLTQQSMLSTHVSRLADTTNVPDPIQ